MFQWLKTVLKFKPACTCVLSNLVGIHNVLLSRESSCPTHGDAALMNSGHCPDCKGTTFQFGRRGDETRRETSMKVKLTFEPTNEQELAALKLLGITGLSADLHSNGELERQHRILGALIDILKLVIVP